MIIFNMAHQATSYCYCYCYYIILIAVISMISIITIIVFMIQLVVILSNFTTTIMIVNTVANTSLAIIIWFLSRHRCACKAPRYLPEDLKAQGRCEARRP